MIRFALLAPSVSALALLAGAVQAQTYNPNQTQQNLNQFQLQLQAEQLNSLQRQIIPGLSQGDPGARAEALARQQQIQRQIDQTTALQQQQLSRQVNPADMRARLQQNGAQIQQLQQQPPIPPGP